MFHISTRVPLAIALFAVTATVPADHRHYHYPAGPALRPYAAPPYWSHPPLPVRHIPVAPRVTATQPDPSIVPETDLDDALRKELDEALRVLRKRPHTPPPITVGMSETG
ncbi:MAG: hypothetical protein ACFCUG_16220 [Thiotrichales bacterium]